MIRADKLSRHYGNLPAVQELDISVAPGEILGLIGPNGAGKTTTLRMLAGITQPSSGAISIAGHDLASSPALAKRATGYVPDDPRLFDALTIDEHLALTAVLYGVRDHAGQAEALLKLFELVPKRHASVDTLSLGMRQKVAICCAYLVSPKALIFDEPLTGLDPRGMQSIRQSIRERASAGAAVIISSHLLDLVESLCTHVLILDLGRCRLHGTMAQVLGARDDGASPASLESRFLDITRRDGEQ